MELSTTVGNLPMVGPAYAKRLEKLAIANLEDLLLHLPHRYDDFRVISKIADLRSGEVATIHGEILSSQNIYTRGGLKIQQVLVADATGNVQVTWFNQPYIITSLKPGSQISLSGKVDMFRNKLTFSSPDYELIYSPNSNLIHTSRLVPIYPETRGLSSKWLRSRIAPLLKTLTDQEILPASAVKKYQLMPWLQAVKNIHFPETKSQVIKARSRLAFEELFLLHLQTLYRKNRWQRTKLSHQLQVHSTKVKALIASLPFKLTNAQNRAVKDIISDLKKSQPMNRLLEGDVGAGKTVVAAIAIYVNFLNSRQSIIMAPTQILASQHLATLKTFLEPLGVTIKLVTAASKPKGKIDLLVGTHALIHRPELLNDPSLIIIDEQHRFGVKQRALLLKPRKQQKSPHLLTMTATPIPRTIALTLYGDLDLSLIDEMPLGRKVVKTWVVPPKKRPAAYDWIKKEVKSRKAQAFIVCPIIEESAHESMAQVKAVTQEFDHLKKIVFKNLNLDILHGRLKAKQKDQVIEKFVAGKTNILVSTPVIEVGIDIPQASIILIEAAERFGLSQLHQLRGRVGRRGQQAYCLLFSSIKTKTTIHRLKALETEDSGLKLAEIDLKLRGPGEIYGTRQHGFDVLKIASFSDTVLITQTRAEAEKIISQDPSLKTERQLSKKLASLEKTIVAPNWPGIISAYGSRTKEKNIQVSPWSSSRQQKLN